MFPTRDMTDAATLFYDLERIRGWILEELPSLEDRLRHGDTDPYLTLDLGEGRRLVIGKMSTGLLTRWVVVAPGEPEPTVHEIGGKGDYARILREVLGDTDPAPAAE